MITYSFADREEAKAILLARDDFLKAQKPWEWSLKMEGETPSPAAGKKPEVFSLEDYLGFLSGSLLEWQKEEKVRIEQALEGINSRCLSQGISLSERIQLVKTSGREEWGSAYTRGRGVILPEGKLAGYKTAESLGALLAHEIFHVVTRFNKTLRKALFGLIGFSCTPGGEVQIPVNLPVRVMTNPDSPLRDYWITLEYLGQEVDLVPLQMLKADLETVDNSRDILSSLSGLFLVLNRDVKPSLPLLLEPREVTGWAEKTGDTSGIAVEPEELLAEYFVDIVFSRRTEGLKRLILQRISRTLSREYPITF